MLPLRTGTERADHPQSSTRSTSFWVARTRRLRNTKDSTILAVKEKDKRMHVASVVPMEGGSVDFIAKRVLTFLDEVGYATSPCVVQDGPGTVHRRPCEQALGSPRWQHNLHRKLSCWRLGVPMASWKGGPGPGGHDLCLARGARSRWCVKLDSNHKIISWIAECASVLLNKYWWVTRQDQQRTHSW